MSGICGAAGLHPECIDEAQLNNMLNHVTTAPCAERGSFTEAGVAGLGNVHLRAFVNGSKVVRGFVETRDFAAVIDGCITNREDALARLPETTDIEHMSDEAHAVDLTYRFYGSDLVRELDGPFAIALWDKRRKSLLLARDRIGSRSLYYFLDSKQDNIVFGSDIRSVLAHPMVSTELDLESLSLHLAFGHVPGRRTLYKGIRKLLPGQRLLFTPREGCKREVYWRLPRVVRTIPHAAPYTGQIRDLFLQTLERYVDGCREVAVLLNGGIDTSVLVLGLRELGVPEISTFSIGSHLDSSKASNHKLRAARLVADHFGTDHHEVIVGRTSEPTASLARLIQHCGDPVFAPDLYGKHLLAFEVRKAGVKSLLSGAVAAGASSIDARFLNPALRASWLRDTEPCLSDAERYSRLRSGLFPLDDQRAILAGKPQIDPRRLVDALQEHPGGIESDDFFRRFFFKDLTLASEQSHRVLNDLCGMEAVAVRSPYMDRNLIELSAHRPGSLDRANSAVCLTNVIEEVFGAELPEPASDCDGPSGFWSAIELRHYEKQLLNRRALEESGVFDPNGVRRILAKDRLQQTSVRSWALIQLCLWHQIHIRQNANFLPV